MTSLTLFEVIDAIFVPIKFLLLKVISVPVVLLVELFFFAVLLQT